MGTPRLKLLFLYLPWLVIVLGGTVSFLKIEDFQNQLRVHQNQLHVQQNQLHVQQVTTSDILSKKINANTAKLSSQIRAQQSLASVILSKKQIADKESMVTKSVVLSKIAKEDEGLKRLKAEVSNKAILDQCLIEYQIYGHLEKLVHILVTDNAHSGSNLLAQEGRNTLRAFYDEIFNAQASLRCHDRTPS
jgi:hypothetical protein